jgi:hypothetical protein
MFLSKASATTMLVDSSGSGLLPLLESLLLLEEFADEEFAKLRA